MKKILLFLLIPSLAFAAAPTRQSSYSTNALISSTAVTANENVIFNYLQAGVDTYAPNSISNTAIAASANIQSDKLNLASISQNVSFSGTVTGVIDSISNYGTSGSASTSINPSDFKIAYGQAVSVAVNSSSVITNLPFTGFTTYRCSVSASTSSTTNISPPVYVGNSGSQMTVYNTDDSSALSIMWVCMGS